MTQAQLVIADEPTPGLHPDVVTETLNHLRGLAREGRGMILITHDIEAALQVADRVAVFMLAPPSKSLTPRILPRAIYAILALKRSGDRCPKTTLCQCRAISRVRKVCHRVVCIAIAVPGSRLHVNRRVPSRGLSVKVG